MGFWFEDIAADVKNEKERPAVEARERFARTSAPIWEAMQTPDASLARSTPDYDEDFTSPGENAASVIGPEYWDEKKEYEDSQRAEQMLGMIHGCIGRYERAADQSCSRPLPGGKRLLPTGDQEAVSADECMRMWADGMPARTTTHDHGRSTTESSGWEVHGNISGEAGSETKKVGAGVGGSYNQSSGTSESSSHSEALSFPGAEGYNKSCAQRGFRWFDEDVDRAIGHWAE